MAHFAKLSQENEVLEVVVIKNEILLSKGMESEELGVQFLKDVYGQETNWKQTSYNKSFRKNFAGVGFKYDVSMDAFIPPKPFPSWVFDSVNCMWNPPKLPPREDKPYTWDEARKDWVVIE